MSRKTQKTIKPAQRTLKAHKEEAFDQQQENFDKLQMQQHDDGEYNALLKSNPNANITKNAYFFKNQRYAATKEKVVEKNEEQEGEQEDYVEAENYVATALKNLKKERINKSKLLSQDIHRLEEEDEEFQTIRKRQKTSDQAILESLSLKAQLELYKDLVDMRYNKQNELQTIKRFPISNFPSNKELLSSKIQAEKAVLGTLNKYIQIYSEYSKKVIDGKEIEDFSSKLQAEQKSGKNFQKSRLNVEQMYEHFRSEQEGLVKEAEKELVKWSQKTSLLNVSTSRYSSLLMQTPVGQTKKVVEQWPRASSRCQQKRSTFRILFEAEEDVRNSSNPQIFDDFQLFNELQKIYVSEVEDQNDFRISDTLRYLKNRESRGQKKQVDRKASKNRKLRFNVHPKLLNFMPSQPSGEIEARDEIVQNIFNCKAAANPTVKTRQDEETYYIDI